MCSRTPLFLSEAKSIISVLLKRTFELFDLSVHFLENDRLKKYFSDRQQTNEQSALIKPCKLNYNIFSDIDKYLQRLSQSCRLIKSLLRSLNAARLRSMNDYIVIDDQIYDRIKLFQSKLNKYQQPKHLITTRYHSQRHIHDHESHLTSSFQFYPETSAENQNHSSTNDVYNAFDKLSHLYQLLLERLYGVHIVRNSDILQPIVINIIRLLLLIADQFKEHSHVL